MAGRHPASSLVALRSRIVESRVPSSVYFGVYFLAMLIFLCLLIFASPLSAQESPYIVTYDHYLEEPGSLEVEYFSTFGTQRGGNDFHAFWAEFEYGATAWWTTEFYLDGQTTFGDSTLFTGFRWENRFRPLQHEAFRQSSDLYRVRANQ